MNVCLFLFTLRGLAAVLMYIETQSTEFACRSSTLSPSEKIKLEVSSYFDMPSVEMDANPFAWWKMECARFPYLAHLAILMYLEIVFLQRDIFGLAGHFSNNSH